MIKWLGIFIGKYFRLIDRLVYSQIEALCSWRNALIVLTAIFCFIALSTGNPTIVTVVFGIWAVVIGFYFKLRQDTDREGRSYKSRYDDEVKKESYIETPESDQENE